MNFNRLIYGFFILLIGAVSSQAQTRSTVKALDLPPVWVEAGPQARLAAKRVAKVQAMRALAERVYGLPIESQTTVHDLILSNDDIRTSIDRTIRGITEINEPSYHPDGKVEMDFSLAIAKVAQDLFREIEKKQIAGFSVTKKDIQEMEYRTTPKILVETGAGAIPGTQGYRRILSRRAAELDGYRKLAERMLGVHITSESSVRDFVLESDFIKSRVAGLLKGAKKTSVSFFEDDSCEVGVSIELDKVFEVCKTHIQKTKRHTEKIIDISERTETMTFSEIGEGAPRPEHPWQEEIIQEENTSAAVEPYQDTVKIIERYVGQRVKY